MKVKKIYENTESAEDIIKEKIYNIIDDFVYMEHVKFTENDYEISIKSKIDAADKIVEYLKQRGLILALNAEKYNI
jgi:hypothetical protein